jgi:uncharacterized membrane protein
MWKRAAATWQRLTGSLWFVPSLITAGAALLAVGLIEAEALVRDEALANFPRLFGAGAESSRTMLAAIAGSMITVAGVTFSITVVAVSQASSQYTPRILRNFMRDRASQVVLGVFVGIFVYCLIVARTIRGDEELRFIPSLAVLGAFLLAVVAMGFLVYFIHHIAGTLEAGSILARVSRETVTAVDRLFPDEMGTAADGSALAGESREWVAIPSAGTGYLQSVDAEGMLRLAEQNRTVIRMERGIGEFVVRDTTIASVAAPGTGDNLAAAVNGVYTLSAYRSVYQDAEFGIRQMVDIALKALSPGVNDSTTAVTSVDHIGAVLVRLARRRIEPAHRLDAQGRLRVIALGPSFESLLGAALDEIRQNATGNTSVLARLLRTLAEVAACTADPARRALLLRHGERIVRAAEAGIPMEEDRQEVHARFRALSAALGDGIDATVRA